MSLHDVVDFFKAVVVPVAIAGPVIALIIDLFLKRIPGWQSSYTVRANLGLNLLVSAGFFFAYRYGFADQLTELVGAAGMLLPILAVLIFGPFATYGFHKGYQQIGVSPSSKSSGII